MWNLSSLIRVEPVANLQGKFVSTPRPLGEPPSWSLKPSFQRGMRKWSQEKSSRTCCSLQALLSIIGHCQARSTALSASWAQDCLLRVKAMSIQQSLVFITMFVPVKQSCSSLRSFPLRAVTWNLRFVKIFPKLKIPCVYFIYMKQPNCWLQCVVKKQNMARCCGCRCPLLSVQDRVWGNHPGS